MLILGLFQFMSFFQKLHIQGNSNGTRHEDAQEEKNWIIFSLDP